MTETDNTTQNDGTWYVLQIMSGQENRVLKSIEHRRKVDLEQGIDHGIQNILLPKQTVEEHRQGGVKTRRDQKLYPGYIFIQMKLFNADGAMISDNWHFVNQTPGVIGFIGGDAPVPIPADEIEEIQAQISGEGEKPRPKILFNPGDLIIFRNGPFENCEGIVESVDDDHSRLKASVSMFGRSTIVEAEFWQVELAPNDDAS
jgi:transcriptional antiterminator NusG